MFGQLDSALDAKINEVAQRLGMAPEWLRGIIAFESGNTFSPSVPNRAGSGAVGLIQFMPSTASMLGTSTAALASMTAVQQMEYVYRYFARYAGRLNTPEDAYMAVLWPAAIGQSLDYVLFDRTKNPTAYAQNAGLDLNGDGKITKYEAAANVLALIGVSPTVTGDDTVSSNTGTDTGTDLAFLGLPGLDGTTDTQLLPGVDNGLLVAGGLALVLALLLS